MADVKNYIEKISSLPLASQQVVEKALKNIIEKELGAEINLPDLGEAASFDRQHDRGPLFGKDFERRSRDLDEMKEIISLSDDSFKVFTERLNIIKGVKKL